jgi:prepilin-type N-terminal cleavage/methylation domain-containing protein
VRGVAAAAPRIGIRRHPGTLSKYHHTPGGDVNKILANSRWVRSDDSGMTLVEVMVAIAIIAIVSLSAGALTILGLNSATAQERRQIAVTIASGAMESVNAQSVKTVASSGVTALLTGLTKGAADATWGTNTTALAVNQTYESWDPTATLSSVPNVPTGPAAVAQAGTTFQVTTLVGTCYQPLAGGDCTKISGYTVPPATTPSTLTNLIRVIVVVRWTSGATCSVNACSYSTSSLFDPHSDLLWVVTGG